MSARVRAWYVVRLAATPTFGAFALACAFTEQHHGGSALTSMWLMYALMAVFHVGPWLERPSGTPRGSSTRSDRSLGPPR